ncbi:MAG: hypothetical protein LBO66_00465 [Deltaproteobacteria bacterium]|nr:hypothetical protein [Deltaproteobacteria bacterium]
MARESEGLTPAEGPGGDAREAADGDVIRGNLPAPPRTEIMGQYALRVHDDELAVQSRYSVIPG